MQIMADLCLLDFVHPGIGNISFWYVALKIYCKFSCSFTKYCGGKKNQDQALERRPWLVDITEHYVMHATGCKILSVLK